MTTEPEFKILNVDDYRPTRYARTKLLRQAGFTVLEAGTGADTLVIIEAERPQLVLLDVNLPDANGYDLCRRIKGTPKSAMTLVVHVTASFAQAGDQARGLNMGADGYLVEPVEPDVLVATVRAFQRIRRAEEAARLAARQWQATFDSISDGVCLLDHNLHVLRVNSVFAELMGSERPPEGQDGVEVLQRILGGEASEVRVVGLFAAGARSAVEVAVGGRWLHVTVDPVLGEDGGQDGLVCSVADISARKRVETARAALLEMEQSARAAAEAASQAKDEFLAVLSHELRTPLTAMVGWIRMLRSRELDEATRTNALEVIDRNTRLQAQIIEDLLDVSRIVSGKLTVDLQPASLSHILEAAINGVRAAATAKDITLDIDVPGRLPTILADSGRLEQVFLNLLTNGIKFTPAGGRVSVSVRPEDSSIRVVVYDTGEGIDAAVLPHIFDRFRQADASTTRRHTGLGLGLAIVRHLVELHGGTIEAKSEGGGRGAVFAVTLPLAPAGTATRLTAGEAALSERGLARLRVLVVEDDADARDLITTILSRAGAKVAAVANGADALRWLDSTPADVLISDLGMPEQDGFDLIRALRQRPPERGGRTPAIALSAMARDLDSLDARAAGYDLHVSKPVDPDALVTSVAEVARGNPR